MKKFFGAIGIAILLMALMPSTVAKASDGRQIAKGVFIGPVDVSGMSTTEAEDAVTAYTKGIELSKKCYEILNKNEELVVKEMTKEGLVPFDSE